MFEELYNPNQKPNYNLITSTSTFILPIIYSCKKNNMILFAVSSTSLLASINYWRKPLLGYRRNIDIFATNFAMITYIYYGFNIAIFYPKLVCAFNVYSMWLLYNKSCKYYKLQDNNWIKYHMLFHLYATFSQLYLIFWI